MYFQPGKIKVKSKIKTNKKCTEIIDLRNWMPNNEMIMEIRSANFDYLLPESILKNHLDIEDEDVLQLLEAKLAQAITDRNINRSNLRKRNPIPHDEVLKEKGVFGTKRALRSFKKAQKVIQEYAHGTLALNQIASETHLSRAFCKGVLDEYLVAGQYLGPASQQDNQRKTGILQEVVSDQKNTYLSLNDYQRIIRQQYGIIIGRRPIRRALIKEGFRYGLPIKEPKRSKRRLDPSDRETLKQILRLYSLDHSQPRQLLTFQDEFSAPLKQASIKHWRKTNKLTADQRHPTNLTLKCTCLANVDEGVRFLMLSEGELTANDFEYFLHSCLSIMSHEADYVDVLLDCATWHRAKSIQTSQVGSVLQYNVPGYFELNEIETMFSGIRRKFRSRPVSMTFNEELTEITRIFRNSREKASQGGFRVNLFRKAIKMARLLRMNTVTR